jgi:type II secretory pathway pseudopilin PulG
MCSKSNEIAAGPVKNGSMQTIKGLVGLVLVALVVFAVAATSDIKSQQRYVAKLRDHATVNVAGSVKTGEMAARSASKAVNATNNAANQARLKTPRT